MSLVVIIVFSAEYLQSGIATVPEFLKRFNEHTRTITTLIFIVAYAGILLLSFFTAARRGTPGF